MKKVALASLVIFAAQFVAAQEEPNFNRIEGVEAMNAYNALQVPVQSVPTLDVKVGKNLKCYKVKYDYKVDPATGAKTTPYSETDPSNYSCVTTLLDQNGQPTGVFF